MGVSAYSTPEEYIWGAAFRISAPFIASSPVSPKYSITRSAPMAGEYMRVAIFNSDGKPLVFLRGDAVEVSKWGQMSIDANPDMQRRRRQVQNLEEQQGRFRMPVACAFDQATNRLIVCDSQRGRLQIYNKETNYADPQANL